MVYVIMGVAGAGKTAVGSLLSQRLHLPFYDGDDFHLPASIDRMSRSIPLNDEDRREWLEILADRITDWNSEGGAVLACSALREQYRQALCRQGKNTVKFIYLKGRKETIQERMVKRQGHFFSPDLLDSQFAALEEPCDAFPVSIEQSPEDICTALEKMIADEIERHTGQEC
ncbi:MAG: gluconokinase [Vulcanimicrobiota bacterium]